MIISSKPILCATATLLQFSARKRKQESATTTTTCRMTDGLIESFTSTKNIKLKYIYIIYILQAPSKKQIILSLETIYLVLSNLRKNSSLLAIIINSSNLHFSFGSPPRRCLVCSKLVNSLVLWPRKRKLRSKMIQ